MGIYERNYARADARGEPGSGWARVGAWSVNTWIIAINVAVFVVMAMTRNGLGALIVQWGTFSTAKAFFWVNGQKQIMFGLEVWRFVTFQFLHANVMHLFFNMFGLYLFGEMVERRLGRRAYASFYIACGVFGAIAYLLLNLLGGVFHVRLPGLLFEDPRTPLVGASAGVFGVLMAAAFIQPNAPMQILFLPVSIRLRTLVYVYVGLAALNLVRQGQNAGGDAAHLGGALAGFFFVRRPHQLHDFFDVLGPPRAKKEARPRGRNGAREGGRAPAGGVEVDRILEKVRADGLQSLTDRERETLRRATEAQRG